MHVHSGWNANFLENHDQPRSLSRFVSSCPSSLQSSAAKLLATFLAFQSGTLFLYQGQEIGMTNMPSDWGIEEYKDVECMNHWKEVLEKYPDDDEMQEKALQEYQRKSRDNSRTPFQWDGSPHAGFTGSGCTPWMRVNDNYTHWNAAAQANPGSVLSYWRRVLALRKEERDVFIYGDFNLVVPEHEDVFAYSRSFGSRMAVVVCNMREVAVRFEIPEEVRGVDKWWLGNYEGPTKRVGGMLELRTV
jgi:glycosidase